MVEFDLAYSQLNEKRIERAWIDLIFENPQMSQVILRDLTFGRRPRVPSSEGDRYDHELTLTKTRLFEGVWEGVLTYEGEGNYQPEIEVTHLQKSGVRAFRFTEKPDEKLWVVRVPIPVRD